MATSTYGTPYVQGSDLVSAYPTVSSSLATRVDEVSYKGNGLNAQTGTTYTLVAGDAGKTITLSNASPVAVTLPQDSTADLPDGAVVTFYNLGAGVVTISQGTGATLQGGAITLAQYAVTSVIKLSANTYGKFDGGGTPAPALLTPTSIANSGGTATLSGGTVTFSAVNSVSLNGVFTATYDNYRAHVIVDSGSASANVKFRMRLSGTDAATNYLYVVFYGTKSAAAGNAQFASDNTYADTTQLQLIDYDQTVGGQAFLEIGRPFSAKPTYLASPYQKVTAGTVSGYVTGIHNTSTAYDGFTLLSSSGTITGTVNVLGYPK